MRVFLLSLIILHLDTINKTNYMKNYIYILCLFLFVSCAENDKNCMPESNGFAPFEGQTVMMGSQATVDIFNQIDDAWGAKDWDLLASYVADDASLTFEDGQTASNGEEFVAIIKAQHDEYMASEAGWGWTTTYAFSIKPSKPEGSDYPNNRGEWVSAGFEGTDGFYMEWYQIEDGKLISWSQTKRGSNN